MIEAQDCDQFAKGCYTAVHRS